MKFDSIYEGFRHKAEMDPSALAVIDGNKKFSRSDLAELADSIASVLPPNAKKVGIVMNHSVRMIAAIFAVLKTGAAYVPVEPFFPRERINFMMNDSKVDCVITEKAFAKLTLDMHQVFIEPNFKATSVDSAVYPKVDGRALAYVLYTSGSTGKPKGVAVTNKNVCHYVRAFYNEFHISEHDTMLQYSVCSFDIFVEEVFASLLSGAVLAIPSSEQKSNITQLMKFVEQNKVTIISGFPYLLQEINRLENIPHSLRLLISGGDVLRALYVDKLLDKVPVYNTYGPSETTVCASYFHCKTDNFLSDGTFPVGLPVLGTEIKILNESLTPVKDGEVGEICILGGGVSEGYIGNLEKENEAFITAKDGKRMYRSGDLGYFLPNGNIAFLRRKDTQIMIYGKRVEPEGVENVLLRSPLLEQGTVEAYTDEHGLSYMIAYVVMKSCGANLSDLILHMKNYLPDYMVPEFFVALKALPLTPNGKIDRKALPVVMK